MTRRSPRRSATIQDVADLVGLSKATVSRALNDSPKVTDETKERIRDVAAQLGYVMNTQARALARGRSDSIAIVFTEPLDDMFADPTYATIVRGIYDGLADTSTVPILVQASSDFERSRARRRLEQTSMDAIIYLTPYIGQDLINDIGATDLPAVLCGQPGTEALRENLAHVYADDIIGARMAATHLRQRGCQHIAILAGPRDNPATRDRLRGYQEVLANLYDPNLVVFGSWDTTWGLAAMDRLSQSNTDIDGVLAASDRIAIGAMASLQRSGRRIPQDVKIIGFDDHKISSQSTPPLTTIHQPLREQGEQAAMLALEMIEGTPGRDILLPMTLVERDSTA